MSNHVVQIGVRNSIQRRAVTKLMRRRRKIVQVGNALCGGFRIMAANAIYVIYRLAQRLFVTKSNLAQRKCALPPPAFGVSAIIW